MSIDIVEETPVAIDAESLYNREEVQVLIDALPTVEEILTPPSDYFGTE